MTFFWILWYFVAVMSLIPVYFFFVGLKDGSITLRNITLWLLILLLIAAVLYGSCWLRDHDKMGMAKGLLLLGAVPGALVLLYLLIAVIGKPRWN